MLVLGVDLAWGDGSGARLANESGVIAVESDGTVIDAGWTVGLDDTIAWIESHVRDDVLLIVDAPLVITNATGQRLCETQTGQRYGRWKVWANSTNLGSPRRAGEALCRRLEAAGWRYDPGWDGPPTSGRVISECYPYTTLVGGHELGYDVGRPLYKRKPNVGGWSSSDRIAPPFATTYSDGLTRLLRSIRHLAFVRPQSPQGCLRRPALTASASTSIERTSSTRPSALGPAFCGPATALGDAKSSATADRVGWRLSSPRRASSNAGRSKRPGQFARGTDRRRLSARARAVAESRNCTILTSRDGQDVTVALLPIDPALGDHLVVEFGDEGRRAVEFLGTARWLLALDVMSEDVRRAESAVYCLREAMEAIPAWFSSVAGGGEWRVASRAVVEAKRRYELARGIDSRYPAAGGRDGRIPARRGSGHRTFRGSASQSGPLAPLGNQHVRNRSIGGRYSSG